ncbi:MAG: hypothetical protein KTR22_09370 [Flavobacteriaceae bacterium]|nr:hypothetical protein [Flavobacteriaceae bacterium]
MKAITLLFLLCSIASMRSQDKLDFQDINAVVNETQRIISINKGQVIDTARFKKLFLPSAQFTVVGKEKGEHVHETMNLKDFLVMLTDIYYSNGYFETGTGQITEEYEGIAHVMQSFYGEDSEGEKGWGVNSYQLIYFQKRWWIANMLWTMSEQAGKDIPEKYLKAH